MDIFVGSGRACVHRTLHTAYCTLHSSHSSRIAYYAGTKVDYCCGGDFVLKKAAGAGAPAEAYGSFSWAADGSGWSWAFDTIVWQRKCGVALISAFPRPELENEIRHGQGGAVFVFAGCKTKANKQAQSLHNQDHAQHTNRDKGSWMCECAWADVVEDPCRV